MSRGRPVGWRKPDAKRESLMIRLGAEQIAQIDVERRKHRCSASEVVRAALRFYFSKAAP